MRFAMVFWVYIRQDDSLKEQGTLTGKGVGARIISIGRFRWTGDKKQSQLHQNH